MADFMVNVDFGSIHSKKTRFPLGQNFTVFLCTIKTQKGEVLAKLTL